MRDYEYIQSCVDRRSRDPFIFSSFRQPEGKILGLELRDTPLDLRRGKGEWEDIAFRDPVYSDNLTRGRLSKEAKIQQALQRLGMAVVGGVFLIGPMWLMVLKKELHTTLITTHVHCSDFRGGYQDWDGGRLECHCWIRGRVGRFRGHNVFINLWP